MNAFRKKRTIALAIAGLLFAGSAFASSHREALAVLNEPCADNTDTYAWVSPGAHDKLYLFMNFNPLHEPGQGNQGLRACNGYRYEFHIGKGTSLKDQAVYRVEFTNKITPAKSPTAADTVGGGIQNPGACVPVVAGPGEHLVGGDPINGRAGRSRCLLAPAQPRRRR